VDEAVDSKVSALGELGRSFLLGIFDLGRNLK
jgi:hypothetical protein